MKVSFSLPLKPLSGKHKFAISLAKEMEIQGIRVTNKKPDVNFVFLKDMKNGCKNIFRLDGVWMNTLNSKSEIKKKNSRLKNIMRKCDGIVYQSEFCKKAGDKFVGNFDKYAVIMNGSSLPSDSGTYKHSRPYLITLCRWRPHKRLKSTIMGFLHSGLDKEFDLLVLGKDPDYVIKHPAIKYMGHRNQDLWSIIAGSRYAVHLAYIDWCPNSVVESLVSGKNVLHTSTGGTCEVVKSNGIMVHDKPWDLKPLDLYHPPELDMRELSQSYLKMLDLPAPNCDYLLIENIAKEYIKFCEEIIGA